MVVVDAHNVIPITRPRAFEASARKAMIHVAALVIGAVVSIQEMIADVRRCIGCGPFRAVRPRVSRIAGVALAAEAECHRGLRAVGYALGFEIPGGAVAAGGTLGASAQAARREDDQSTQRSYLYTLPPSLGCRVLSVPCHCDRLRCSATFPRAYPSPDVSWAQEPHAAKTVVQATSVYPRRKPVRSRCPKDSC
jgi:hypothetical protein